MKPIVATKQAQNDWVVTSLYGTFGALTFVSGANVASTNVHSSWG